jgi:hypothetical protein
MTLDETFVKSRMLSDLDSIAEVFVAPTNVSLVCVRAAMMMMMMMMMMNVDFVCSRRRFHNALHVVLVSKDRNRCVCVCVCVDVCMIATRGRREQRVVVPAPQLRLVDIYRQCNWVAARCYALIACNDASSTRLVGYV